jgi:TolB-like protein/class 3 adenylate cyclase/Tfp pilus assembly protein PilF
MATARVERRLAAILAADVAGYSRLMERDEDGTFARLKRLQTEVVAPALAHRGGRIVDLKGDGAMVEFRSAVAAVEAAVDIQRALQDRDTELPEAERIRLRIGINLGEVIVDGGAIYGDGVNVAARIECLCEPGGVWLTRAVRNEVEGKLDLALVPAGPRRVKNIGEAVDVFRVAAFDGAAAPAPLRRAAARRLHLAVAAVCGAALVIGGIWWARSDQNPPPQKPDVAVLPFANLDGDAITGRLANGITQDIVTDLARFRDLDVIAPTSLQASGEATAGTREARRGLDAEYVLEGSIQRQGDRVRVSAQLVDSRSGTNVWSERWDRPIQDVFAVQAELAEQVASHLGGYGRIADADRAAARRKPPGNLTAYDLYMLGVEAKHRMTRDGWAEAAKLLQRAIALDSGLARAWTALSWVRSMSAADGIPDAAKARAAALDAARRAVELDPADSEGHAALGVALGALGDLAGAEPEFEEALRLNPNHPGVLAAFAGWASNFGRPEDGAAAADRLVRLDPSYPAWAAGGISYAYLMAGRFADALRALSRIPEAARSRNHLVGEAVAHAALGHAGEAEAAVKRALTRFPDISAEAVVSRATFPERYRERAVEALASAGFPVCAQLADLPKLETSRLPECETERAAMVGGKL